MNENQPKGKPTFNILNRCESKIHTARVGDVRISIIERVNEEVEAWAFRQGVRGDINFVKGERFDRVADAKVACLLAARRAA